jgi:hypothetical protein
MPPSELLRRTHHADGWIRGTAGFVRSVLQVLGSERTALGELGQVAALATESWAGVGADPEIVAAGQVLQSAVLGQPVSTVT